MNWDAFHERENNKRFIRPFYRQGAKVLEIDRTKVLFKGRKWLDLSTYDKRKFENNLFIEHSGERLPLKFLYL